MQSEDFDNKIKGAAENHHPPYDEKAWEKMEQLLDVHLPQEKEKRRGFIFFLLLFLLLGTGLYMLVAKPWRREQLAMDNKQETIDNRQRAIDNKQLAIGNEQRAIDNEQGAIGNRQEAIDNKQQTTDKKAMRGMMNIGVRPTVDGTKRVIEVNIFDFDETIYGKRLTISIKKYLRNEVKFNGLEELKDQLAKDKENATLGLQ